MNLTYETAVNLVAIFCSLAILIVAIGVSIFLVKAALDKKHGA